MAPTLDEANMLPSRHLQSRVTAVALALAMACSAAPLAAQTPEKPVLSAEQKREVGELLLEAKRAYSSKDYEVALDRLVKAYDIYPDANVQRRIGEALERLRRDRDALEVYRRVLARDDVEQATRDAVERRVTFLDDVLRSRQAVVSVSSPNLDTTIWVDGESEPRGTVPLDVRLDPGSYTLRAELPGEEPQTRSVKLVERDKVNWTVDWTSGAAPDDGVADAPADTGGDYSTLGWVSVGAGALVYAGSAVALVLASSRASTLDGYDAARDQPRPADYDDVQSEYNTLVTLSWVGAGVGTLFTAIGAVLLITSADSDDEPVQAVGVQPTRGGANVTWSIRW
jgi:tetratricopeptide (TPR) repeat protein